MGVSRIQMAKARSEKDKEKLSDLHNVEQVPQYIELINYSV